MPADGSARAPVERIVARRDTWLSPPGMVLPRARRAAAAAAVGPVVQRRDRVAGGARGRRRRADLAPVARAAATEGAPAPRSARRAVAAARCACRPTRSAARASAPRWSSAAALVFLWLNDALRPARDVLLAVVVVVVALALILAPWWLRLVRGLAAERAERIRSQERAEVAAHLHDSVLQTLALVQKRADDPREVAALARRQERELRAWLNGRRAPGERPLAAALEAAAAEVEETHGVPVEVVAVGDAPLDERGEALVAAAREALVNAAKFAGRRRRSRSTPRSTTSASRCSCATAGRASTPTRVPADRRGVRESIVGRMERHGGRAVRAHRARRGHRGRAGDGAMTSRRDRRRPPAVPRRRARRARRARRRARRRRDRRGRGAAA